MIANTFLYYTQYIELPSVNIDTIRNENVGAELTQLKQLESV